MAPLAFTTVGPAFAGGVGDDAGVFGFGSAEPLSKAPPATAGGAGHRKRFPQLEHTSQVAREARTPSRGAVQVGQTTVRGAGTRATMTAPGASDKGAY